MNLSHKLIKLFARAALMLGLTASAAAWAQQCDVSLVTVFANGQAVLKADCSPLAPASAPVISSITWFRDGAPIPGVTNLILAIPTTQDIYYTTAITAGTSTYTAVGNPTGTPILAGKAATITSGLTALTTAVAPPATGTITCTTPTQPASNCTGASTYPVGTAVTLNAVGNTGYSLAGWGGDCNGTGACVVVMTAPHTVIANFASTPVCTLAPPSSSITAGGSVTLSANCNPAATSYTWTGATCSSTSSSCTVNPSATTSYTVAGNNTNGPGAASNTATVTVSQAAPVCTLAASQSSVLQGTAANVTLTSTCSGSPSSFAWSTSSTAAPSVGPTSTTNSVVAAFASTTASGSYTYFVTATNSGGPSNQASTSITVSSVTPPSCTLTANPTAITVGGSSTLTASCPTATSYIWTGGSCSSTSATCTVTPAATTAYTVVGTNSGGNGAAAGATVTVNAAPPPPPSASCPVTDVAQAYPGWQNGEGSRAGAPLLSSPAGTTSSFLVAANRLLPASLVSFGTGSFAVFEIFQGSVGTTVEISNTPCTISSNPAFPATCQRTGQDVFSPKFYGMAPNTDSGTQSLGGVYGYCTMPQPALTAVNGSTTQAYYINVKQPNTCNQGSTCQYFVNFWTN